MGVRHLSERGDSGGVGTVVVIVLAVLAIILVVLIRLPSSRADWRDECEASAAGRLRSYYSAQIIYRRADRDGDGAQEYADKLPELVETKLPDGRPLGLLDAGFLSAYGDGGKPVSGYVFRECRSIGGRPIDWAKELALCAAPAEASRGVKWATFIVDSDGVVWRRARDDKGFVDDLPADPTAAGWSRTD
jgi:hypothetical protein